MWITVGKVLTLLFWFLFIVNCFFAVGSTSTSKLIMIAGLGLLVVHALEVIVFSSQIKDDYHKETKISKGMVFGALEIMSWSKK